MEFEQDKRILPPVLPLSEVVPLYALKRRFGISFSSSSCYLTTPRFERRGGISFERTDKNAIYIRMLGDVKLGTNPEQCGSEGIAKTLDAERKMLDTALVRVLFLDRNRRPNTLHKNGTLECLLASHMKDLFCPPKKLALPDQRRRFRSRFMSMNKTRRQRKCQNRLSSQGRVLLDEFYNSPAQLLLSRIGDWDFNIFNLDPLAGGRSLFHVAYHLFQNYNFIKGFHLDTVRLLQFFSLIEQNYHESNPYHNALHAADVTQSMHCFLQELEIQESTSDLEKMAALVASLTHDLDHPGVNNGFLIATSNHLATLYQNISVLENHHWRSAVGLLQESGVLSHLSSEIWETFTSQVKTLILATDITRQQEFLLKFSRYIDSGEFQYRRNQEHRHFMLQIALKCADISNPCRSWRVSRRWSERVCDEFFLQGDTERALNIAVTPICDRVTNTIPNIQHGFMQFVVSPLFKAWDRFLNTDLTLAMLNHLSHNQRKWKEIIDKEEELSESSSHDLLQDVEFLDNDNDHDKEDDGQLVMSESECEICKSRKSSKSSLAQEEGGKLEEDVDMLDLTMTVRECSEDKTEEDHEEEGRSEEDDIVRNDVNLLYKYQTDSTEHPGDSSGRCLSPVSEDSEHCLYASGNGRRFSVPYLVRKDLNFYLGLRREGNGHCNPFSRRQSLPVTAIRLSSGLSSMEQSVYADAKSPRSMSMDALLTRPKISNLSPNMDASFISGSMDPLHFVPIQNQTVMLQKGSLTRFTSNPTSQHSSSEYITSELSRLENNNLNMLPSDLIIPPFRHKKAEIPPSNTPQVGLAASWPVLAHKEQSANCSYNSVNITAGKILQDSDIKDLFASVISNQRENFSNPPSSQGSDSNY